MWAFALHSYTTCQFQLLSLLQNCVWSVEINSFINYKSCFSFLLIFFSFCLCCLAFECMLDIIICPIAIAYSMGQIIKSVCVCQSLCVCLSVCRHSYGRISLHLPFPYFTPKNCHFWPRVLKINANMKNTISTLNVHVSPKFPRVIGNRGRGTRWWGQSFDRM